MIQIIFKQIAEGGDSLPGSATESPVPSNFQNEEELKIEDVTKKQVKAKTLQVILENYDDQQNNKYKKIISTAIQ